MNNKRRDKRISTTSFIKYFTLKVPHIELSDSYIQTIIALWEQEKNPEQDIQKVFFELQKKRKLLEFFTKLRQIHVNKLSSRTAYSIVKVLYKNASSFSRRGSENLWNSEYDKAEALMMNLINEKINKGKIASVLNEAVLNTPDIPFAVRTVLWCKKDRQGSVYNIYESINLESLKLKLSRKLKKYFIDEKRNIFSELRENEIALVLYQWGTNWGTLDSFNKRTVNNYVLSLVENDYKNFSKFLYLQREHSLPGGGWTIKIDHLSQIYNLEKLKQIALKFKADASVLLDEREIIELFLRLVDKKMSAQNKEDM